MVITAVHPTLTRLFSPNLTQVSLNRPERCLFHALASTSSLVLLSRLRRFGQPGYDLLSQQPSADSVHDSRIQKCTLQVRMRGCG